MQSQTSSSRKAYNLENGLAIRCSTAEDTEKITELMSIVWRSGPKSPPNQRIIDQMRLHMRGDFPWMKPTDFVLIEDTEKPNNPAVACGALWLIFKQALQQVFQHYRICCRISEDLLHRWSSR